MKNKIAFLTIVSAFVLSVGCGFAFASALGEANLAKDNPDLAYTNGQTKSGDVPDVTASQPADTASGATDKTPAAATPPAVSTGTVVTPPAPEAKPTLMQKMTKDLQDNKVNYAVAGGLGAMTGYFMAGCVLSGALLGFGIIILAFLLLRNVG